MKLASDHCVEWGYSSSHPQHQPKDKTTSWVIAVSPGLIVLLTLCTLSVKAGDYPECDISKTVPITYSGQESDDILRVTIKGKPCYEAFLDIQIKGVGDQLLYQYHAPFKRHIAVQWDDPSLDKDADKLALRLTNPNAFSLTSKLPTWKPENEYYEENYQVLQVTREYYIGLREKKWRVYSHLTHYEGGKVIVFDINKHETIEVSNGGL